MLRWAVAYLVKHFVTKLLTVISSFQLVHKILIKLIPPAKTQHLFAILLFYLENSIGERTFVIEEAVLREDEPSLLPQHETFGALFVEPTLEGDRRGERPLRRRRTQTRLWTVSPANPRYRCPETGTIGTTLVSHLRPRSDRRRRLDNLKQPNLYIPISIKNRDFYW